MASAYFPKRYFRGNTFDGLITSINIDITDLLNMDDVTDDEFGDFAGIALAANDAMREVFTQDLVAREDLAA